MTYQLITVDVESELIRPGRAVPRLVCMSTCGVDKKPQLFHRHGNATSLFLDMLKDPMCIIIGHNLVYDLAVLIDACRDKEAALRLVFGALDAGRLRCTQNREKLWHIREGTLQGLRKGSLSLAGLVFKYFNIELKKGDDTYRLRYQEFIDVPLGDWPFEAKKYAMDDALHTMNVFLRQQEIFEAIKYTGQEPWSCVNEVFQMKKSWATALRRIWGIRTDAGEVDRLETLLKEGIHKREKELKGATIIRLDGSQNMAVLKDRIIKAYAAKQTKVPATEGGDVSTSKDTLKFVKDVDPLLKSVYERKHLEKVLNTFVAAARLGVEYPITSNFNSLIASGRESSSKPNLYNLPQGDPCDQVPKCVDSPCEHQINPRWCFIPREGHLFSSCDYETLELRTLGQACHSMGIPSRLREAFIAGRDPHAEMGAQLARLPYKQFDDMLQGHSGAENKAKAKSFRQRAKPLNFGYPGGLGAAKFIKYAEGYNIHITENEAKALKVEWLNTWPEMNGYFKRINDLINPANGLGSVKQLFSGRIRGGCFYTVLANTIFQGLAADLFGDAAYHVAKECYLDRSSDLYGSRPVVGLYDELLTEHPREHAGPAAQRLSTIMVARGQVWTPDVPQVVKPALMNRWDKEAAPRFSDKGDLIAFDDEDEEAAA